MYKIILFTNFLFFQKKKKNTNNFVLNWVVLKMKTKDCMREDLIKTTILLKN